jgi:hypothetical protein
MYSITCTSDASISIFMGYIKLSESLKRPCNSNTGACGKYRSISAPKLDLDAAFEVRDGLTAAIRNNLSNILSAYGLIIHECLILRE